MNEVKLSYLKTPIYRNTFRAKTVRNWVEGYCRNKYILNLYAGKVKLSGCREVRNDFNPEVEADYHLDAILFVDFWCGRKFDGIILDPPYSDRKSMEMYHGFKASKFNQVKSQLSNILKKKGFVITFGYHSVSMGQRRGFQQVEILLMSHGGAIHDTIAVVEQKVAK